MSRDIGDGPPLATGGHVDQRAEQSTVGPEDGTLSRIAAESNRDVCPADAEKRDVMRAGHLAAWADVRGKANRDPLLGTIAQTREGPCRAVTHGLVAMDGARTTAPSARLDDIQCSLRAECQTPRIVEPAHDRRRPAHSDDRPLLTAEGQSGRKYGGKDESSIRSSDQVAMHDDPPVLQVRFGLRCPVHALLSVREFRRPDTIPTARREFADMTTNHTESAPPAVAGLVFMDRMLDVRREVLVHGNEELRLRPRTFGVLTHLLTNAGRVVTKQELMDVVWADAVVTEDSLVQCLIEIRRALGGAQDVVKTVRGRGYLVDCEVRRIDAAPGAVGGGSPLGTPPDSPVRDRSSAAAALAEERMPRSAATRVSVSAAAIGLTIAGAIAWTWVTRGTTTRTGNDRPATAVHFTIQPPPGQIFGNGPGPANAAPNVETTTLAVSPDGTRVAMVAADVSGRTRIWIRPLAGLELAAVAGTDGAGSVFWSPDGRSIGFPAEGKLKRLDLATGTAVTLCDLPPHPGGVYGTWGADAIVYSAGTEILRVAAEGGTPQVAVQLDADESGAKWPWFLPDGRRFLYMARLRTREGRVKLMTPGKPAMTILAAASNVQWVDPGYLVFARDGALVAQRFDPDAGRMTGELLPVAAPVVYSRSTARAAFAVSRSGVLAYQPRGDSSRLVWVDASGSAGRVVSSGDLLGLRLSPDGKRALFSRATPGFGTYDLWYVDLNRGAEWRLTSDPTSEIGGQWLPDGGGVVFSAERQGSPHLFLRRLNEDNDRELRPAGAFTIAHDVARDGVIAFEVVGEPRPRVVWGLRPDGGEPVSLMAPRFDVDDLRFAPDNELVAFVSSDSERAEVYVAPRAAPQQRVRVSTGGGRLPRWGGRSDSLFYLSNDGRLMSTTVRARPSLVVSPPRPVLTVSSSPWVDYDVTPDGRFLAIVPEVITGQQPLTVLFNWLPSK